MRGPHSYDKDFYVQGKSQYLDPHRKGESYVLGIVCNKSQKKY